MNRKSSCKTELCIILKKFFQRFLCVKSMFPSKLLEHQCNIIKEFTHLWKHAFDLLAIVKLGIDSATFFSEGDIGKIFKPPKIGLNKMLEFAHGKWVRFLSSPGQKFILCPENAEVH
ncbi:hypothetical protein T01_11661 [Trichinella spiralis]|uniref:Uncharacterized protein n=1 Tax=Trichinella spiralis TaxID=6334 RepID=A0A0V1BJ55_TRISP|nr:hypothetical protein T01_11661 [Trichinella spiralis]